MILLDTNVFSELLRPTPDAHVHQWAQEHLDGAGTTSMVLGELRCGALRLPSGNRREQLLQGIHAIEETLRELILPFDHDAAREYALLRVARESDGTPVGAEDLIIAAIARSGDHIVATRNTHHFEGYGVKTVNPWD